MGHLLPTTLFIKVALCLVWLRPCCVLPLTLLSVLKICAILLISDVLCMIPQFFQGLRQIHVPSLCSKTHRPSWTIPSLTTHL